MKTTITAADLDRQNRLAMARHYLDLLDYPMAEKCLFGKGDCAEDAAGFDNVVDCACGDPEWAEVRR